MVNHGAFPDEGPDKVELAPGTYIVKACSEIDGLMTIPVSIKLARIITVYLEDIRPSESFDPAEAVKSPSGQIVGWKY